VTLSRRSRSRQTDGADHDEDDRIRVAEREIAAAHLIEKKKHADGNDDGRAHQSANGTSAARASNTITHRKKAS
jgi:hypothetical protein